MRPGSHRARAAIVLSVTAVLLLAGCGGDTAGREHPSTTVTKAAATTTTSGVARLEQPAIWPAANVVFPTPEAAAEDFVTKVLGVPPVLGEFRQGDARSGEIEVLSPGEGDHGTPIVRSVLLLRQLGPGDGWFILGAVNENATISSPASMSEVAARELEVEGMARGFEGNVVVTAFVAGEAARPIDRAITQGGATEAPLPYRVSLDLSDTSPGEIVTLLVRGGTGLETDPGDFGAVPVVIAR